MSFFSSIPTWGWFDIGFNVAVLVALGGETDVVLRWIFPDRSGDLLPPETKREKLKFFCEWLLILGIAGEISCLPFSLYGTASAEKDAAEARLETARLEKQIAQTSTNLSKINPYNRDISEMDAFVTLVVRSNNIKSSWDAPVVADMWLFGDDETGSLNLSASHFPVLTVDKESMNGEWDSYEFPSNGIPYRGAFFAFHMQFHMSKDDGLNPLANWPKVSAITNETKVAIIHNTFLPSNEEVLGGLIKFRINNDTVRIEFPISAQKVISQGWVHGRDTMVIATNCVPTPNQEEWGGY